MSALEQDDNDDIAFIVHAAVGSILAYCQPLYFKEPYHMCPFKGYDWVQDLMAGHPGHIHHELGVHLHIFECLLHSLQKMNYSNSKYITLEGHLAIFLYGCVTGLSIRHLGKRFQCSNDTISKFVTLFSLNSYG